MLAFIGRGGGSVGGRGQLGGVGLVMSPTPHLSPTFNRNNKSPPFDRCTHTVTHAKRAEEKSHSFFVYD